MEKHINIVAAIRIAFSILHLIIGIVGFILLQAAGNFANDQEATFVLAIIANVVLIFCIVCSIPGLIAGFGLLKHKEWARILTLILSVLDLLNFPLGTAVGVYSIWALTNNEVTGAFKKPE
jgi:apolipoprotein N-acyltransferase